MKKLIALLLSFILVFCLAACGGSAGGSSSDDASSTPTEETVEITLNNWFDYFDYSAMTDASASNVEVYFGISLKDEVAEKCTDASVKFTVTEQQGYPCQMEYNIQMSDQKINMLDPTAFSAKYGSDKLTYSASDSGEFKKTANDVGVLLKLRIKSAMEGSISQTGTVVTWDTVLFQTNDVTEATGTITLKK